SYRAMHARSSPARRADKWTQTGGLSRLEGGWIRVESVGPHRRGFAVLVDPQDLRLLALLPELLGGIDREQHRLAFAEVGPEFLAVERDEPDVLLTHDQITRA